MNRLQYLQTSVQIKQLFTQVKWQQYEEYVNCKQKNKGWSKEHRLLVAF